MRLIESAEGRLGVVIVWHLHQPQYRDQVSGQHVRPWAYLHAIKDYVDMAVHLESVPGASAVVNFSPVLLEQLDDYCGNLARHLHEGVPIRDPLLAALAPGGLPTDAAGRAWLQRACARAHPQHQVDRFPAFRALVDQLKPDAGVTPARLQDLVVWYHLAWLGETVRRGDPRVELLMRHARDFGEAECRSLLEVITDVLAGLVPRYRRLAGSGRIELSVSPWGHPVLPLMFDFAAARAAEPGLTLPEPVAYPGGADRARWHLARAVQVFSRSFGLRPRGCWPAEGAISDATLDLLERFGFDWVASSESVLQRSLREPPEHAAMSGWRQEGRQLACFFRDDALSDRIGFGWGTVNGEQLAADVIHRLETIAAQVPGRNGRVVTLVMDGQNAWEYHPDNGHAFLQALYRRLVEHPSIRLTTFSRCLQAGRVPLATLPALTPGSWIGGTLSTWIGSAGRNEAWRKLCEAKQLFDQVVVEGGLDDAGQAAAEEALGVCEGSDWFWWMDDGELPADSAQSFDRLYRRHLGNLYGLLQEAAPDDLHMEAPRNTAGAGGG